ncbi:response regulator [Cohnella sp. GCM10027633]|uniref:response regulator n=1 Tax=unclassified Cohnella TaxID=2636738 RepID=UPI00363E9F10
MIHVVIVDDQTLLREGLQTIVNLEDDMRTAGLAANGQEAYEITGATRPDVVLMDIKMPVLNGIEGMRRIKADYPGTLVLMLTTFLEDDLIVEAMAGGADGFLLKDMAGDQIVQTIREALRGHLIMPAPIAAKLAARVRSGATRQHADAMDEQAVSREGLFFNDKERQIIRLMVQEKANKQIAAILNMSEGTVRNYVSLIYNKIGTNERAASIKRLKELLFL